MALNPYYSLFTRILQSIDLKPAADKSMEPTSVRHSNEQSRAAPLTQYYPAIAQNTQGQDVQAWRSAAYIRVRRNDDIRHTTPRLGILRNRSGFSYLGVLILVAVMSISLIGTGRYWSTIVKRELEAELLYRGDRIREAIASYYNNPPGGQNKTYPRQFSDLLKDPRYPSVKRHLRKWYTDPMNRGKDWVYILDASQRLKGVHSAHQGTPLKIGNFPKEYGKFERAQTYEDWTFVFVPKQ
jgi:type II secretory pathway pseudopilin PulG